MAIAREAEPVGSLNEVREAGLAGALCDEATRDRLRKHGDSFDWAEVPQAELV